mmetsp:Transcript_5984/g.5145  ORF Transcript_5984/g.5145 Transcript_5984/m.5145 type:complete len:364 (-) Transcript_5984:25-1116(-)
MGSSQSLFAATIIGFFLQASAQAANTNSTEETPIKNSTPFTHWSWLWAIGCLVALLTIREYVKTQAGKNLEVSIMDEFKKRDGTYRREDYEADTVKGALQTCPKDEDGCISLRLAKKTKINHDTFQFRFNFPKEDMEFGLPIGGHVVFYAMTTDPENGKEEEIARKYTPTSVVHQKGYTEFVIKIYRAGENERFPHGGRMTQYLEKLNEGDSLKIEGPKGKLSYIGCGNFYIQKKYQVKKNIGMVAGGSGITPMYQIIQAAVHNQDKIMLSLLFGNKTEKDILIREELEQLKEDYPNNFDLTYIIDQSEHPETWKGETGYITEEILKKYMPNAGDDVLILTCGPPIMCDLVTKFLPNHMIHKF